MANFVEISTGNRVDFDKVVQIVDIWMPSNETGELAKTALLFGDGAAWVVDPDYFANLPQSKKKHETY